MVAQRKVMHYGVLILAVWLSIPVESSTLERDAPDRCDETNPCPYGLACVSGLTCIPADKLMTALETSHVPMLMSSLHHQFSNYKPTAMTSKGNARRRRDVSTLKKLLGEVPENELREEEHKLAEEIKALETVEDTLKSDLKHLDHVKPNRQHTVEKNELKKELNAMKKLEGELIEQEDVIEGELETSSRGEEMTETQQETSDQSEYDYSHDYDYTEESNEYSYSEESKESDYSEDSYDDSEKTRQTDSSQQEGDSSITSSQSDYEDSTYNEDSYEYDYSQENSDFYGEDHSTRDKRLIHKPAGRHHKHQSTDDILEEIKSAKEKEQELEKELEYLQMKLSSKDHSSEQHLSHPSKDPPSEEPPLPNHRHHNHNQVQAPSSHGHRRGHSTEQSSHKQHHPHGEKDHRANGRLHRVRNKLSDVTPQQHKAKTTDSDVVASLVDTLSDGSELKVHKGKGRITKQDTSSLDTNSLERKVLDDVQKAKSRGGLSVGEASLLQDEAESLEHKENDIVEDLIHNTDSGNKLDDLEKRILLEQLLQELLSTLDDKLSKKKKSTHWPIRSVSQPSTDYAHVRPQRYASWVSALKNQQDVSYQPVRTLESNGATYHYRNGERTHSLREKRSPHHHHKPHKGHHKHHSSEGRKDLDRCERCEAMVGEEVCGGNGKTYNSLCHAVNCAGLSQNDISAGACALDDVCEDSDCREGSECVALMNGVCLSLYSVEPSKRLSCRQYMCVSEGHCSSDAHSHVCGLNGKTYPSLCYLHKASVQLAYSGACRPELCKNSVCGRDGVTYSSVCHARARGVRVDYPGDCFAESTYPNFHGCADVVQAGRCPKLTCAHPVLPRDSCCHVCGGALVVHPDTKAMAALITTWKDVNHLYIVENFLRKLLSKSASKSCELSATLTNAGNLSVVLESVDPREHALCQRSARQLADAINGHSPQVEDSMLRPMAKTAAMIDLFNPMDSIQQFMQDTQDKVLNDLPNKARGKLNEGLQHMDRETNRLENQHHYSSGSHTSCVDIITVTLLVVLVVYSIM